jgi:hypothetical protein
VQVAAHQCVAPAGTLTKALDAIRLFAELILLVFYHVADTLGAYTLVAAYVPDNFIQSHQATIMINQMHISVPIVMHAPVCTLDGHHLGVLVTLLKQDRILAQIEYYSLQKFLLS